MELVRRTMGKEDPRMGSLLQTKDYAGRRESEELGLHRSAESSGLHILLRQLYVIVLENTERLEDCTIGFRRSRGSGGQQLE